MITIKSFVFSDFHENTFVLSEEGGNCIIIDPGCNSANERSELKAYLDINGLKLQEVLFTHCHLDHVFGAGYLVQTYPGVDLKAHQAENPIMEQGDTLALMFGVHMDKPPTLTSFIGEKDNIKLGKSKVEIIHAPGHSPGSLCFYSKEQRFILAGDVLFSGSIGRSDLPGGNMETLLTSIRQKLFYLPEDTTVWSGHGPTTTIGREKQNNPFLKGFSF